MDKLEVAQLIKSYILSFEDVKCEDDDGFVDLYIHENAKPGGLIHFSGENDYAVKTLFSYEHHADGHTFFMNNWGGVDNLFKINEMSKKPSTNMKINYHGRLISQLQFVKSYCSSLEAAIPTKYKMLDNERVDNFRIDIEESSNNFVISHTTAFYSYRYPSVHVTFVFDKNHKLLNIGFDDPHVKALMQELTIERKIKAFSFFIDYFVEKEFREHVNIDYTEVNLENLDDYLLLHAMHEV